MKYVIKILFISYVCLTSPLLAQEISKSDIIIGEVSGRMDYNNITSILETTYQPVQFTKRYNTFKLHKSSPREVVFNNSNVRKSPRKIVFRFFESELEMLAALITNEIDFTYSESIKIAEEVQKANPSIRIIFQPKPLNYVKMIAYNNKNPLFSSREVRQALTIAINKHYILRQILDSRANLTSSPVDKQSRLYENVFREFKFNPQSAIKQLQNAGWYDSNQDGILENRNKPFRFVLYYEKGVLPDEDIARMIKLHWLRIGIDVSIQPLSKREIKDVKQRGEYDAILMNQYFGQNIEYFEDIFSESGKNNYMNYSNKTVNYFFQLSRKADNNTREQLFRGIINTITLDQPATFLFFIWIDWYFIHSDKLQNFQEENGILKSFDQWQLKK